MVHIVWVEVFPSLLWQMWDELLKESHCQSVLRSTGIFYFSHDAVMSKLDPSDLFSPLQ